MQGIGNDRPLDHTGIADRSRLVAIGIDAAADLALGADRYISVTASQGCGVRRAVFGCFTGRSEEHTSELQSLMRISYAVFCLKKKKTNKISTSHTYTKNRSNCTHRRSSIMTTTGNDVTK